MLTRRHFIITSAALFSAPLAGAAAAQDAVSFEFDSAVDAPRSRRTQSLGPASEVHADPCRAP
jgi:hypothetical protein